MADKIQVDIEVLSQKFTSEMSRVQKQLGTLEKNAAKTNDMLAGFGGALGKALSVAAIVAAGKAIYQFTNQVAEAATQQSRLAERLDLSTEFVDRLDQAFARSHVDIGTAHTAIERFTKSVGLASTGNDEMIKSFAEIGIAIEDIKSMSPDKLFLKFGEQISKLPNAAQMEEAITKIAGRGSGEIIDFFKQGPEAMQKALAAAVPMTDEMRKNFAALDAANINLSQEWKHLENSVASKFAPAITTATDYLTDGIKKAYEFIERIHGDKVAEPDALLKSPMRLLSRGNGKIDFDALRNQGNQALNVERNRALYEPTIDYQSQQPINKAVAADDSKAELLAKAQQKYKNVSDEILRNELASLEANKEIFKVRAEYDRSHKRAQEDIAAVGNKELQLRIAVNRELLHATKQQKEQAVIDRQRLELTQKLQSFKEGTATGALRIESRDIASMQKLNVGSNQEREDLRRQSLDRFMQQFGGMEDIAGKHKYNLRQIKEAENSGLITSNQAKVARSHEHFRAHDERQNLLQGLGKEMRPLEEFGLAIQKADAALKNGEIGRSEHARITGDLGAKAFDLNSPRLAGAQMAGSQEAYKTLVSYNAMPNADPALQTAKNTMQTNVILGQLLSTMQGRNALGLDGVD